MSLFVPDGDRFVPTGLSRGPWDDATLNGGPVAALVARAAEHHDEPRAARVEGQLIARLTVDLVRGVPMAPLTLRTTTLKPGRRIQVIEVLVEAGGEVVTRATAVRMPAAQPDFRPTPDGPPPGPDEAEVTRPEPAGDKELYHSHGAEYRAGAGEGRDRLMWVRLRTDLLPGEPASPAALAAAASDAPSGMTGIHPDGWRSINADITTHLTRPPEGEWLGMVGRSHSWSGIGFAEAELHDLRGRVGRSVQTVLVEPWTRVP